MYKIKQEPGDFVVEEISGRQWSGKGPYTYFLLKKRDYTTEDAIQFISRYLNMPRNRFGYAGSKDRNALTTQVCSVLGGMRGFAAKDIEVTVLGRADEPVSLGDLAGNSFAITVRNISDKPSPVDSVINYFDEQRFSISNFEIGLSILKGDFRTAALLVDKSEAQGHLEKYKGDYVGAIRMIPLKTRTMYISSVQSFFWNSVASGLARTGKHRAVKYSLGEFIFPEEMPPDRAIPLVSFDLETEDREIMEMYRMLLAKYSLTERSFVIRQMPELTARGGERNLIASVSGMKVGDLEDDELNQGMKKSVVSFSLGKGSYATIVLKSMLA